mmetsp:Transcript_108663/g.249132  ORF Transcript_108663/g.249132 Transcript_108663/m.249132 type:complete len:112 (+) Transcript_108663:2370-2705(+)
MEDLRGQRDAQLWYLRTCVDRMRIVDSVRRLGLQGNGLTDVMVRPITGVFKVNRTLEAVNLSWNELTDGACKAILAAVQMNRCVSEIDMTGNIVSEELLVKLVQTLNRHKG